MSRGDTKTRMNEMTRIDAVSESYVAQFTTAEFLHMCEIGAFDDMKVELVDGELHRFALARNEHARLQALVMAQLWTAFGSDAPRRACGGIGIDLGHATVFHADAAVLSRPDVEAYWPGPSDFLLIVEVSDMTLKRDLGIKQARYAAAGVPHYWVVSSSDRITHVFAEPANGTYQRSDIVRFGEPIIAPETSNPCVIQ